MIRVPKFLIYFVLISTLLALIPPFVIWQYRSTMKSKPRPHLFLDMDNQARFKSQHVNTLFADGRANRPQADGTVARGEAFVNDHMERGWVNNDWVTTLPPELDASRELIERGRERFNIYCSVCHGVGGYGDGMVHQRAQLLVSNPAIGNGTVWVPPKSIHSPEVRDQPIGEIYNTITNGIRNMAGYAGQVPMDDRWAIALYVKALQRSQFASPSDLPGDIDVNSLPLTDLGSDEAETGQATDGADS